MFSYYGYLLTYLIFTFTVIGSNKEILISLD